MENAKVLLNVQEVKMYFPHEKSFLGRTVSYVKAVDGVSFAIRAGETYGLVGESGCGKTTVGKCVLRLLRPTAGQIIYDGQAIENLSARELRGIRRQIQMVFQDPYGSLDPRQSVRSILKEAIVRDGRRHDPQELETRIEELITMVGMDPAYKKRYPHEMSGGQRQRIGIARALACEPQLLVCDEPVSALDVSIQAEVINLFQKMQKELKLTYLFVAHDLAVVQHIADRIGIMYLGHLVEEIGAQALDAETIHPYTIALLSAVPTPDYDAERSREQIVLEGEVPSPLHAPAGCPFHPRCRYATEECRTRMPALQAITPQHKVACHRAAEFAGMPRSQLMR